MGRVKIDVCGDAKVAVAVCVLEHLAHVPDVLGALVRVIDREEVPAACVAIEKNLVMGVVEGLDGLPPAGCAPAPALVELSEGVRV